MIKLNSLILLCLLLGMQAFAQPFKDLSFNSSYSENPLVEFQFLNYQKEVYVRFSPKSLEDYQIYLLKYDGVEAKNPTISQQLEPYCIANDCTVKFDESFVDANSNIVLKYIYGNSIQYELVPIPRPTGISFKDAFGDLFYGSFIRTYTDLVIEMDNDSSTAVVNYYSHNFVHADPPTGLLNIPQKSLNPDTTFTVNNLEVISFTQTGLYYFKLNDNELGFTIRVENDPYPKYNRIVDLRDPLVYIAASDEWEDITAVEFDKEAFDRTWLDFATFENNATRAVRLYYKRVELANKYFTNYKSGWKTDMGLVFTVFGQPDDVKKSTNGEIWVYTSTDYHGRLSFVFSRSRNAFSDNFILNRKKEYLYDWNNTIDNLRKGKVYEK